MDLSAFCLHAIFPVATEYNIDISLGLHLLRYPTRQHTLVNSACYVQHRLKFMCSTSTAALLREQCSLLLLKRFL
jgi:hypothetical protein